ncbi:MAG: hypothetical protein A3A33_00550 [Candidatus Yanofskybacteria bacterium RIFCSPLOWO2_01_FULL_49_25]|uniref:NAD-dependent epimerase/dehydratase domain-containing protein n=1 Tax=Candidatus Yanofskybacteria bacterium RIFCSPLOWO2_01_FULL_49_25 TaxID=1802701 RepID=A0A1F8GSU5_9BACT|nr:MAG: hypothetical protein A3A33_00550 [Candidatus Yanofskybacteria bacterium RIFCSPLOWO2_01_FULL_49_25]
MSHSMKNILVTGAFGQIGSELVPALLNKKGVAKVIALDNRKPSADAGGIVELADITDAIALERIVQKYKIDTVFHLVSLLSATGEKNPNLAWDVNMGGLKIVLDLAVGYKMRVFWPSSIAAFGPTTPRDKTPQKTILEPTTMYGVTKVAGELLCQYYFLKYGVDVRSVRYPGLISWKAQPGGGTTDYAVAIFHEAIATGTYECFVKKDTVLPMMYMDDAIRGTLQLMDAPASKIKIRTSYNLAAMSFRADELAREIQKHVPCAVTYKPDHRQKIADSWPRSINDSQARKDWGWKPKINLVAMTKDMLKHLNGK